MSIARADAASVRVAAIEDVAPEAILHALSDPNRAAILARILTTGRVDAGARVAEPGDRVIPKSSLSNHFRVLRDAGRAGNAG